MQAMETANLVAVPCRRLAKEPAKSSFLAFASTWQATALLLLIGIALGGYLGGISVLYAWTFGRRVVLNDAESTRRRVGIGLLTVASAVTFYSVVASIYTGLVML